jgi:hypothetical protein
MAIFGRFGAGCHTMTFLKFACVKNNKNCLVELAGISHHRMNNTRSNPPFLVSEAHHNSGNRKKTDRHRLASSSLTRGRTPGTLASNMARTFQL